MIRAEMRFDLGQLSVLRAAVDRIAPADVHGPGAIELGVVDYVEAALEEGGDPVVWAEGLAALEGRAVERYGAGFDACTPAQRDAILAEFEEGAFFELLRDHVLQGMFGDPSYGGNRDRGGWRLLSYPGPKLVWSEAEQQLDAPAAPAPGADA